MTKAMDVNEIQKIKKDFYTGKVNKLETIRRLQWQGMGISMLVNTMRNWTKDRANLIINKKNKS